MSARSRGERVLMMSVCNSFELRGKTFEGNSCVLVPHIWQRRSSLEVREGGLLLEGRQFECGRRRGMNDKIAVV